MKASMEFPSSLLLQSYCHCKTAAKQIFNLVCASTLIVTYSQTANAGASDENFQRLLNDIQQNIFPLVMANRPIAERNRAQGVKIKFVPDFFGRNVAMANSDTKEIILSSGFMWGMWVYSEATLIESYTGNEHFREWYFHYLLWRHPAFWNGDLPALPAQFFGLSDNDTDKALNDPRLPAHSLFTLAIIEVLLHELGHIALNATYTAGSSSAYKLQQEVKADNWAREAEKSLDDTTGSGRMIALGYLNELERFYGFSNNIYATHPTTQERFKVYVDQWCASLNLLSDKVCDLYKKEYELTFSTENQINKYKTRAAAGEAHAAIKLGDFYLEGKLVSKNIPKACKYYKQAYTYGDRNLAALNYGWCMGKGYFGSEQKTGGKIMLEVLAEKGWSYAKILSDGL